jgi:hypothetical protein
MKGGSWGELVFEFDGRGIQNRHGRSWGVENGDVSFASNLEQRWIQMMTPGNDETGEILLAKLGETFETKVLREFLQIGIFGVAEDLNALVREIVHKTGEGESGAIHRWLTDEATKSNQFLVGGQLKIISMTFEKLTNCKVGDDFPFSSGGHFEILRRRPGMARWIFSRIEFVSGAR